MALETKTLGEKIKEVAHRYDAPRPKILQSLFLYPLRGLSTEVNPLRKDKTGEDPGPWGSFPGLNDLKGFKISIPNVERLKRGAFALFHTTCKACKLRT